MLCRSIPLLILIVLAGCGKPPVFEGNAEPTRASGGVQPSISVPAPTKPEPAPEPNPEVKPEPKLPMVPVDLKAEKDAEAYANRAGGTPLRNVSHIGEKNALITINFLGTDEKPADVKAVELKKLAGAKRLNRLGLLGSKNTDAGLKDVAALPMLSSVSLEGSDVTEVGLALVAALPNLKELDLSRCKKIPKGGWKALSAAGKLETLWLSAANLDDAGFRELGGLKSLVILKLDGTNLTLAETGATFAQFQKLIELDVGGSPVGDEGVLALCAARSLEKLTLRATNFTDAGFQPIAQLLKLKELQLGELPHLTGTGFADIAELRALESVILSDSGITDKGMKAVGNLRELKHLDLDRTKITDDGIKFLASKRALEKLSFQETKVGDSGLLAVAGEVKSLKKVEVRKTKVTRGIFDEVRKLNPDLAVDFD